MPSVTKLYRYGLYIKVCFKLCYYREAAADSVQATDRKGVPSSTDLAPVYNSNYGNMTFNFIFVMQERKLTLNARKKFESQVK